MAERLPFEAHGVQWPAGTSMATVHLGMYRIGGSVDHNKAWHMSEAVKLLWPSPVYEYSYWTDKMIEAWCMNDWATIWGASSTGKAQPLDAIIYTPDKGAVRMGDIEAGDRVVAQSGKTSEVIRVWDRGELGCYRVTFSDGSSTECAGDHLWEVGNISNHWGRNRVVETDWLEKNYRKSKGQAHRFFIPMCEPVYFRERRIEIDPYVFGALLGDGSFRTRSLSFSCASDQLAENIRNRIDPDYELSKLKNRSYDYRVVKRNRLMGSPNKYVRALKRYDLWECRSESKFIPADYLFNSVEVRKDILSGLMDTDGYASKQGGIVFSSVSERLAKGVVFLVQSLGGVGRVKTKQPWYKNKSGEKVAGLLCYNVHIRLPDEHNIFKIDAKSSRIRDRKKNLRRYITDISYIGMKEMRCITIDHPRGLYLTNDFICTHNSTTFGMLAVAHWISAPFGTTMTVCSTSKEALLKRIWCEILKFYSALEDPPGRYYPGRTAIIYPMKIGDEIDDDGREAWSEENSAIKYSRNGIFGVAVQKGSVQESFSNLIGVHNTYNAMILDEMQEVREAAVEAVANLQGGKEFKFMGMGNPWSRLDLLGRYSKPKSGKWSDCNENMTDWETERGRCYFFDGRKSPAIVEPGGEQRFSFLLKAKDIEIRKRWFGEKSRKFWSQTVGFIPPDDAEQIIFTETFLVFNLMDTAADWDSGFELLAGVDWSFTEGGDRCVVQPAKLGLCKGVMTLEFQKTEFIPIEVEAGKPSSYLVARRVRDLCKRLGVEPNGTGADNSGTQGPQNDILEQEWDHGVLRVNFSGKASMRPVIGEKGKLAKDLYGNRMTELWYQLYNLGRTKQVRGVDAGMSLELISRKLANETPLTLESKRVMKPRVGFSPDIADAAVVVTEVAIERFGLVVEGLNVTAVTQGDFFGAAQDVNINDEELFSTEMEAAYGSEV